MNANKVRGKAWLYFIHKIPTWKTLGRPGGRLGFFRPLEPNGETAPAVFGLLGAKILVFSSVIDTSRALAVLAQ
jgi:hypothetical protein